MKITHSNKIVIGSSITIGIIILIPTLFFNLPFGYLLAAMLLTTIIANWYIKLTCESYSLQVKFDDNQRLIISIVGKNNSDLNVVHFCVKSPSGYFEHNKLEEKLIQKGITFNDFNLICIDGQVLTENKYIEIHRKMLFYRDLIAECISLCLIPPQSINTPAKPVKTKRKSILFWR